jgi:hypothetical protein
MKNYWGLSKSGVALAVAAGLLLAPAGAWARPAAAADAASASDTAVNSEPAPVPEHGPRMHFKSLEHDFGEAMSGTTLKTTFVFKNVGDEVLHIQKVSGG